MLDLNTFDTEDGIKTQLQTNNAVLQSTANMYFPNNNYMYTLSSNIHKILSSIIRINFTLFTASTNYKNRIHIFTLKFS